MVFANLLVKSLKRCRNTVRIESSIKINRLKLVLQFSSLKTATSDIDKGLKLASYKLNYIVRQN